LQLLSISKNFYLRFAMLHFTKREQEPSKTW